MIIRIYSKESRYLSLIGAEKTLFSQKTFHTKTERGGTNDICNYSVALLLKRLPTRQTSKNKLK